MTILGEKGMLTVRDLWDNRSPVNLAVHYQRSLLQKGGRT